MQGASSSGTNRWTTEVPQIFQNEKADIILLQECGQAPTGELLAPPVDEAWLGQKPDDPADCLFGTYKRSYWMMYAAWDTKAKRCNMAVCSREQPSGLIYANNQLDENKRPMIGMRISNTHVSTLHAFSGSGNDGPSFVRYMKKLAAVYPQADGKPVPWFVGGDFNRSPEKLAASLAAGEGHLWTSGYITHPGREDKTKDSQIDYGVGSAAMADGGCRLLSNRASDHIAVWFDLDRLKT